MHVRRRLASGDWGRTGPGATGGWVMADGQQGDADDEARVQHAADQQGGVQQGDDRMPVAMGRAQAETLVRAAYHALLMRDADPGGLQAWTDLLLSGSTDPLGLMRSMLGSEEFATRFTDFLHHYVPPEQLRFTNDTSQFGETWLLLREMVNAAAAHRIVVDVGARGKERSNSYDLLRHCGWRGLLVEANPALIPEISREFAGLDLTLLNYAVSDYSGEATFFLGANDDVSSLNQHDAAGWGDIRGQVKVTVERLPTLLAAHEIPRDFDMLSIDAEGEDVKILNDTVAGGWMPRWVIIEASDDFRVRSLRDLPLLPAVVERYKIVVQTKANLILRSRFR